MSDNAFEDDMVFDLDTGDIDEESLYTGGGGVNKDGKYHVMCIDVANDTKDGKLPCVKVVLQVLAGTERDQVDKKHTHWLYLAKWADDAKTQPGPLMDSQRKGLARFARAFHVLTEADMGNPNARINFNRFRDMQAVVEIKKGDDRESDGKTYSGRFEIPWNNAWPVNHPDVADVPKDAESLALMGGIDGMEVAAAGPDDEFGDL